MNRLLYTVSAKSVKEEKEQWNIYWEETED